MTDLLQQVKDHVRDNYDKHGYDIVWETMTDTEILEVIGKTRTVKSALRRLRVHVRPWNDQRKEQLAEA